MVFGLFKTRQPAVLIKRSEHARGRWKSTTPEHALHAPRSHRVRVTRLTPQAAGAVTVHIEPVDSAELPFRAGQYLTHCLTIDGLAYRRAYSISAAEGQSLSWTCKPVADGRVSPYVASVLEVGDEYEIRGPAGGFLLPDDSAPLILVAGGSGITPLMSIAQTALAAEPERTVLLIYASREQDAIIFRQDLDALAARAIGFQVVHVLSQPAPGWTGESGRLDGERVLQLAAGLPRDSAHWYLCGPAGLMDSVSAALSQGGLPDNQQHRENFLSATRAVAEHPQSPQPIRFSRSAVTVQQAAGQSILDAGLAAGLTLQYSCTVGGCAACKLRVLDGDVILDEPNCLSDPERQQGYTLACSAYAAGPITVDA